MGRRERKMESKPKKKKKLKNPYLNTAWMNEIARMGELDQ